MLPVVAIVGRPNVGKSSLFNRLVGKRHAIESVISGTTRDTVSHRVSFFDQQALLVDTGGLEITSDGDIEEDVQSQARAAIEGADLVIFVVDVRTDLTASDFHAADLLRKSGKACVMVANKCDHVSSLEEKTYNFYELGFGEPVAISAIHGTGLDKLKNNALDELGKLNLLSETDEKEVTEGIRISFVGRPNVGKSSLINALFGKAKVIVSDVPGTTRDAVETPFEFEDEQFVLIDTAGVRRRGKVEKGIEKYSVLRSLQAIEDSDICVLVIDGSDGVRAQDLHVVEFVLEQGTGLVVVVNKIDTFEDQDKMRHRFAGLLRKRMAFVPWAPVVFTSATKRTNVIPVLQVAADIYEKRHYEVDPKSLEFWLDETIEGHVPSGGRGVKRSEILKVEQTGVNPPVFTFKVRHPEKLHFSYVRYLENRIRESFGFDGTCIKINFKKAGRKRTAARKEKKKK
ncbi:ribosome biogenesis GTPase Der [Candidatus Peregrinibacteria bacterium]|jgi:GTPase|nr:ribosome biogenesis GTPase Der [Candidatus Peregrinibacteria bacterium]MBT7483924.1 ribosome biogenesis GTPase Der [Candidatus Peregrinibacteria bacterium]MBT7702641.1 ribosome biogenesis GTPase Der [Candidatus Peregrinibacteria bacterium]